MRKKTKILAMTLTLAVLFATWSGIKCEPVITEAQELLDAEDTEVSFVPIYTCKSVIAVEEAIAVVEKELISKKDLELLALLTMAEAEGEPEKGQRLVIDTVLNRVDSEYFPDTIYDVIWQKNQFSSMTNGRIERCKVMDDICQLILEEIEFRGNYEVIFFNANHYSKYGVPLFKTGNHYFSSYD